MEKVSSRIAFTLPDPSLDRPLIGYIRGDEFSIAFDAGASGKHVELFYSELGRMKFPLPSLTVISHHHWDHSYGIAAICGLSIANEKTYCHLQEDMNTPKENLFLSIADDYDYIRKEYLNPENIAIKLPDLTYKERMTIYMGDIKAELYHTESPHTDDSTLLYIPEEKVLFAGDAASGVIETAKDLETGGKYNREKTISLINTIKEINPLLIIDSHSGITSLEEELSYLESKLEY